MAHTPAGEPFGTTAAGPARRYTLDNGRGLRAEFTDYGATLVRLAAPDRAGRPVNVVLSLGDAAAYEAQPFFLGATIGRFANRIAGARFPLDGREYRLPPNDGPPDARGQLHGGSGGFHRRLWRVAAGTDDSASLTFHRASADGEEGFPGNLEVFVTYSLARDANDLRIDYRATADRPTPINLTHHSYFNLAGAGDILGHELQLDADAYLPVDRALLPTGAPAPVGGTPFDFRVPRSIGAGLAAEHPQLRLAGGFDHNYLLRGAGGRLRRAAVARDPGSGRILEVHTTEPGLQFYSGNFLSGAWRRNAALCLEPQHFPDAPNRPEFPSTILRPGGVFTSTTLFRFRA